MIVGVDKDSDVPVYEQIRSQIEALVRDGLLPPGTKLPSVRELAPIEEQAPAPVPLRESTRGRRIR